MTSLKNKDDVINEYINDPDDIHEKYEHLVDLVLDGGEGNIEPTTVIDCQNDKIEIIRQGKGELSY